MAGATLTTLSNLLKEYYLPPVVEQLNNQVLILQRLEKRDQELYGKLAVVPVHTSRSGSVGARGEGGTLPTAGNQQYARATFDLKYLYGTVQVTGPSMAKTASESGSFLQALKSELDGIRNDLSLDLARQMYGDGTGSIATTAANAAVATLTLQSAEPLRKGFLYPGAVVDIGTVANPTADVAGATVSSVNIATPSITIGSAITTAAGDIITRQGANSASATYEVDAGLQKLVSTAANSVGTIDASQAANAYWDNLRNTTGGALSLDTMMQAYNQVKIAGGNLTAVIGSYGLQRAFFNLLQSQVRYTEPTTIKGGFNVLEFMGQPFIADRLAPFGKLYFLDESYIKVFTNRDWHFLDEDGTILKWVPGTDQWQAVLARYLNMGISRRNCQMVVSGLTDANGF